MNPEGTEDTSVLHGLQRLHDAYWCMMFLAAVWKEQNPFYDSSCEKWHCLPENDLATSLDEDKWP